MLGDTTQPIPYPTGVATMPTRAIIAMAADIILLLAIGYGLSLLLEFVFLS